MHVYTCEYSQACISFYLLPQVESASTLITTAKNLMKTVVETVKTCYVASSAVCEHLNREYKTD